MIEGRPEALAARGAALELDGIVRRFGTRWVLRGITLRVEPGTVLALTGAIWRSRLAARDDRRLVREWARVEPVWSRRRV